MPIPIVPSFEKYSAPEFTLSTIQLKYRLAATEQSPKTMLLFRLSEPETE